MMITEKKKFSSGVLSPTPWSCLLQSRKLYFWHLPLHLRSEFKWTIVLIFKINLWQRHLFTTFEYQNNSAYSKSNHLQGGSWTTWPDKNEHDHQSVEYFQREWKQLDWEYDRGGLRQHRNRCQRLRKLWTAQRKVQTKDLDLLQSSCHIFSEYTLSTIMESWRTREAG